MSARNVQAMQSMSRSRKVNCIVQSRSTNIVGAGKIVSQVHLDLLVMEVIENSAILLHCVMEICLKELQISSKLIILS